MAPKVQWKGPVRFHFYYHEFRQGPRVRVVSHLAVEIASQIDSRLAPHSGGGVRVQAAQRISPRGDLIGVTINLKSLINDSFRNLIDGPFPKSIWVFFFTPN